MSFSTGEGLMRVVIVSWMMAQVRLWATAGEHPTPARLCEWDETAGWSAKIVSFALFSRRAKPKACCWRELMQLPVSLKNNQVLIPKQQQQSSLPEPRVNELIVPAIIAADSSYLQSANRSCSTIRDVLSTSPSRSIIYLLK